MTRVKTAYNAAKSLIISRFLQKHARVIDIGSGTDVLKYSTHEPLDLILVDASGESLAKGLEFAIDKGIQYPVGQHMADVFSEPFSESTTTVYSPVMVVPRRVKLRGTDLVASFSALELCKDIEHLQHFCDQVAQSLKPGGVWIGCLTNGARVLERCDEKGHYADNYCAIQMNDRVDSYRFTTATRDCQQHLWTVPTLVRIAERSGLVLCLQESLLDVLGNAPNWRDHRRKLKLHMDDLPPLSLLSFFCFTKPCPEHLL